MNIKNERPPLVTTTLILILIGAFIWLAFGILIASGLHPSMPADPALRWVLGILCIGCSVVLVGLVILLARRIPLAWYLVVGLLTLISILAIADDFGLVDLLFLLFTLVTLCLLLVSRRWFLQRV